ncbi:uncharacterized protein LOC122500407 isoform X2 [Leptopilina heterotoma]|nr:uncharacterized protein LOC122500407 isoform X2 [Leptopilina heterotoma]
MPLKLKDLLSSSDDSRSEEAPSTDRKKLEPMKIKDLIKSCSARKKTESAKFVNPSKSVDRHVNVPRKSVAPSSSFDVHARRKLYTTQNTPHALNRQSKLKPTSQSQPQQIGDNRNLSSRKSLLLPPNTIKEYYIHRRKSKGATMKTTHEDVAVQTDTDNRSETKNNTTKDTKLTNSCHCGTEINSEIPTVLQSLKETALNKNAAAGTSICTESEQISTNSCVSLSTAGVLDSQINSNKNCLNSQLRGLKSSISTDNDCVLVVQPLPQNQVFFQVPESMEHQRILRNIPTMNYTCNSNSDQFIVDRTNFLAIEEFLKEGIVNMTQALSIVQATLYSNSLQQQMQSTVSNDKERTSTYFATPVIHNIFNPASELCDIVDVKIEPTYGDTSPPIISMPLPVFESFSTNELSNEKSLTPTPSETNSNNKLPKEKSAPLREIDTLRVRLENCLKFPPTANALRGTSVSKEVIQKSVDSSETSNLTSTNQHSQRNPKESDAIVLKTPTRNAKRVDNNLLKTPKTIDRNPLLKLTTPSRRIENKENFQTPMSRRKTFSGLDSQKLRRSARIARHHLRQSLGEDSFLALERELDIVYPSSNV